MIPIVLRKSIAVAAIREFVAHSYLYYEMDDPIISDQQFDELEYWICDNIDWIRPHDINKYLLDPMVKGCGGSHLHWKVKGQTLEYALYLLTQHT